MNKGIAEKLMDLERELAHPSTRTNRERLDELIADDFEEFGSSGRVIRKENVLDASGPAPEYQLSAFSVRELGESSALVTYRASFSGKVSYRSSVWIKTEARWQIVHHQSTVVPEFGS